MFDFTNHIVLNEVSIATADEVKAGTKANVITNKNGKRGPEIRIAGVPFNTANVESIQYAKAKDEVLATATLDLTTLPSLMNTVNGTIVDTTFKIDMYVALSMHSQDPFYANPWNQKGKHVSPIEFVVKASDITTNNNTSAFTSVGTKATEIFNLIKKYMQLLNMGEKVLDVEIKDTSKLVFTAINGFQIFKEAILQRYEDEVKRNPTCCGFQGDFVKVADLTVTKGQEAFLDYDWMIHNLRLPTLQNLNYWTLNKEMPAAGAKYNQYIIKMVTVRDGIAGGILGQRATSVTTHVFYVNAAADEAQNGFNATMQNIFGAANILTDADTELANPATKDSQLQKNTKKEAEKYKPVAN